MTEKGGWGGATESCYACVDGQDGERNRSYETESSTDGFLKGKTGLSLPGENQHSPGGLEARSRTRSLIRCLSSETFAPSGKRPLPPSAWGTRHGLIFLSMTRISFWPCIMTTSLSPKTCGSDSKELRASTAEMIIAYTSGYAALRLAPHDKK